MRSLLRSMNELSWSRLLAAAVAVALVALGVAGAWDAAGPLAGGAAAVVVVLGAVLKWWDGAAELAVRLLRVLFAAAVGMIAVVGFGVVVHAIVGPTSDAATDTYADARARLLLGLGVATVVLVLVSLWYAWTVPGERRSRGWVIAAPVTAFLLIVVAGPLLLVDGLHAGKRPASASAATVAAPVPAKIDVRIVTGAGGSSVGAGAATVLEPAIRDYDVRFSVGHVTRPGGPVRWTVRQSEDVDAVRAAVRRPAAEARAAARAPTAAPIARPGADPLVLLLPDGLGDRDAWQRVAIAARAGNPAGGATTRTIAVLPDVDPADEARQARLRTWDELVARGAVLTRRDLPRGPVTAAATWLAAYGPTVKRDLALAERFRPVVRFDEDEPVPHLVSVDALLERRAVAVCDDPPGPDERCDAAATSGADLASGGRHLRIRVPPDRALDEPAAAAMYVHPVTVQDAGRSTLYLDYWWYLTDNPVDVGGGALCGPGLVVDGVTCLNHQSDWEGITVVVDVTEQPEAEGAERTAPAIRSVQYAAHSDVVEYRWDQLRRLWNADPAVRRLGIWPGPGAAGAAGERPLAFVAAGTHSTYALPCSGTCRQLTQRSLGDGERDGRRAWPANARERCGEHACLQPLPTRQGGATPALWSAFTGVWGEAVCVWDFCITGTPPKAPGQQGRYRTPSHSSGTVDARGRYVARP